MKGRLTSDAVKVIAEAVFASGESVIIPVDLSEIADVVDVAGDELVVSVSCHRAENTCHNTR